MSLLFKKSVRAKPNFLKILPEILRQFCLISNYSTIQILTRSTSGGSMAEGLRYRKRIISAGERAPGRKCTRLKAGECISVLPQKPSITPTLEQSQCV